MHLLAITLSEPAHFSLLEIALLLLCVVVSAGLFCSRLAPIAKNIWQSRKDPGFTLSPISRRIWDFIWEVMCQAKVIKERPAPGIAHAFVFWGFCAFVLVSLNHFAVGVRLGFLSSESYLGRFYFYFAAAFALTCAISIAGLFIRRFFVRPIWLGKKVSYESGFIAFLIFVLMVTYLAAFFTTTDATLKALWWTHTLALLIFLPLIPHTKHLHLVLSPITVFLSRNGFSAIPPLVGDDDFGLVTGKDLTQLISLQAYSCVECGRCTEHCPAANTGKLLNPKEIILGVRQYLNTSGPHSESPLLSEAPQNSPDNPPAPWLSMEAAFECTTCGACEYQCPVGIEHLPILIGLRRGAVNTGAWEDPQGTKLFLALEKNGNALGLPSSQRDQFIAKQNFPIFDGSQEYCLWLGCMGGYDPKGREIISDFARIMDHLGTTFGVMKKEKCTGDPARRLGNDLVFQQLAEDNLALMAQAKVQKIIAICPHCVRTIATDWKEFGISPEVEHHSEFMARHKSRLPLAQGVVLSEAAIAEPKLHTIAPATQVAPNENVISNSPESVISSETQSVESRNPRSSPAAPRPSAPSAEKIVYHDPCYLGRYQQIYEAPREIVAQSGDLVEAPRNHDRSFCCGAGGGLAFLGEEKGDRVSNTRANELIATGATTIATACPFCNTMFRDAIATTSTPPQLLDIAQLTARNLPAKRTPPVGDTV